MTPDQVDDGSPKPPKKLSDLQRAVDAYARSEGVPVVRVQRRISFMVLCAVLERVRMQDESPAFLIKGGVSLELRFKNRARATKDLDALYRGAFDTLIEMIDKALATPYGDFTLRREGETTVTGPAYQIHVRIAYRGRTWGTVPLEVSSPDTPSHEVEQVEAMDIATFGLTGPATVSCLPLNDQIAQKLHALTEISAPGRRPNARFRDAADLLILREVVLDWPGLRNACEATFRARHKHSWPPIFVPPEHWRDPFERLAGELGVATTDITDAAVEIQDFIAKIVRG